MVTSEVVMMSLPPLGMASRAFTTRFMMTCSIMPVSASMQEISRGQVASNVTSSPSMRVNMLSRFWMTMLISSSLV